MVVPLLAGAVIATFAPGTAKFFGSFTEALFNGALTILAVFYVCMGTTIELTATPYILKKGGTLLITKILCGVVAGIVLGRLLGEKPVGAGPFLGLSTLAVVAAMNDTNGGLYMALMGKYGLARDVGAYSVMTIESGPFLTMVTLGVAGLSAFPWQTLLGVCLGLAVVAVTGAALIVADRLTGGNGVAGLAAASTAGNAAAVPAIVAAANPVYQEAARTATVLVAASVVVTAVVVPFVTAWWAGRAGSPSPQNVVPPPERSAAAPVRREGH